MSFGFPRDDPGIREAIETVMKERKDQIIFFASAGNSSSSDESFPARHPYVISVFATDRDGMFLPSNAASAARGATVLGTYGEVPDDIGKEFVGTKYEGICKPGSSVATAVMAGIAATLLSYVDALPLLVGMQGVAASTTNRTLRHIRSPRGMEAVLHRLAQDDPDHPRFKAVKPPWFWKNKSDDTLRYCAICDALSDVDKKLPRPL